MVALDALVAMLVVLVVAGAVVAPKLGAPPVMNHELNGEVFWLVCCGDIACFVGVTSLPKR